MTEGIIVGIVGTVGAAILIALVALITRQWKSPKRLDRLEGVVPPMARGIFALLEFHVFGDTSDARETMKASLNELREVTTDKMVSQKAKG